MFKLFLREIMKIKYSRDQKKLAKCACLYAIVCEKCAYMQYYAKKQLIYILIYDQKSLK